MRVIDLTQKLSLNVYAKELHVGTHVDAPAYVLKGQKTIDQLGLQTFPTVAALLDLTHKKPGEAIDDEDLEAAEEAAGLALREGETVVLYTTIENESMATVPKPHVYLSKNAAEYLEFKRVGMVGIDAPSIDRLGGANYPAHVTLLSKGILVLEGLCNLEKIDLPRFQLAAFPLRLNAPTSPVRAVAILED